MGPSRYACIRLRLKFSSFSRDRLNKRSKTKSQQEAQTGEIDLSEDDPEIVEHMMNYLYKGCYDLEDPLHIAAPPTDYSLLQPDWISRIWKTSKRPINPDIIPRYLGPHQIPQSSSSVSSGDDLFPPDAKVRIPSKLLTHANVYCMAEQYDIPKLKNYALCKYASIVPTAWKSPYFLTSLRFIYDNTCALETGIDDLRAVAAKTAAENACYFLDRVDFLECCVENGEIGLDVLRMTLALRKIELRVNWKPTVECPANSKHPLLYIPHMMAFGAWNARNEGGTMAAARYKCLECGNVVK